MLYIFDMDSGRMLTFDMSLALDTVQSLKQAIERHHAIPACSQVLLVSGGETLESNSRVCNYAAGTDSNPIFMFSNSLEPRNPAQPWPSIENENEIKSEVDRCLELPSVYATVVRRAQLAQQILELSKDELKNCDKLVFEQHLQHQGWMAVIANLEDITDAFQERGSEFDKVFRDHIDRRMEFKEYLESFDDNLLKLAQIPILPPLIQGAEEKPFHAFDDVYNDNCESFATAHMKQLVANKAASESSMESAAKSSSDQSVDEDRGLEMKEPVAQKQQHSLTLLQWISSNENQRTLKRMAENCTRELEVFDKNVMESFKDEIEKTVETAKRGDMKEIKGLEERLQGLEGLKREASKLFAEQSDIAQALLANQQSASRAGDASILPDLCAPHRSQFQQMLKNHKKLREIRIKCARAKDELCKNLLQRLKFVIHVENKMCEIDCKLLFYHRCLRRLQKHLGIIEQIHQAPCVYVQAVTEVVRRRIFSTSFLVWASELACHLLTIYNEEVVRRTEFRYSFDGHFLNTLFPGIDDFPPRFATEAPSIFDSNLPQLTKNDLSELSKHLPELTKKIQLPNLSAIIDFFSSRSSNSNQETTTSTDENVNPSATKKLLDIFPHIKEDYEKGCESETDTEEYEKIGQMSIDKKPTHQSICVGTTQPDFCDNETCMSVVLSRDNEMVTDDNMLNGLEVNRLQQLLVTMYRISQESTKLLKQQLLDLKTNAMSEQQSMRTQLDQLVKAYDDLKTETHNHERELIQQLTVDHELEMNDLTKKLFMKEDEISTLKSEKEQLESDIKVVKESSEKEKSELRRRVEDLELKVQEMEKRISLQTAEKEAALKALKEDHRNEIESLRCKYKLMTSSKTSPSEACANTISLENHQEILDERKRKYEEDLKIAVEKAVQEALERAKMSESSRWSLTASIPQACSPGKSPKDNQEIFKRILEEKDRQLEQMREHVEQLLKESVRLKGVIQNITDENQVLEYKEKLEIINNEKQKLERELEKERIKRAKLNNLTVNGGVTINSCSKDDIVLVVWNSTHEQYTIVQDSSVLYFLHAESYNELKLTLVSPNTCPRVCYCIGKVTDKEYCHAKKDENRYKVGKGTKFYRVKVRARSPSSRGEMERSGTERKKIKRSTDSQSDSSKSMKLERQPSNLISSFAQTDTTDSLMTETIIPAVSSSSDMVDSGVGSQHNKSSSKEQNLTMEDDEDISLTDDQKRDDDDRKDDEEEEEPVMIKEELTSLDDSDDYRSLEGGKDDIEDTEF